MTPGIRTASGVGAAAVILLALVLAGCGGASATSHAMTPTQASAAFNTYNRNNAKANETLNIGLQNQNETGTSAQIDDADYQALKDQGKATEGKYALMPKPYAIYPLNYAAASLKKGGTEYFVATAGKTSSPYSAFLFAKTGTEGTWQVLYEPTMLAGTRLQFIANGGGYYSGGPLPKLVVSPSTALNDYVNYLNGYANPSTADLGPLAAGPKTTGFMTTYANVCKSFKAKGPGLSCTLIFSEDSSPIVTLPVKGGALTFAAYDLGQYFGLPANAYAIQNAGRTNWSALLPPGRYHGGITEDSVVQVAMFIPTKGRVQVLGSYGGIVSALGS